MKRLSSLALLIFITFFGTFIYAASTLRFELNGVSGAILTNVQTRLGLAQNELTTDNVQQTYNEASQEIRKALEPYGYFKPAIQSQLSQKNSTWVATFDINPGPEMKIARVEVTVTGPGKTNPKIQKYLSAFSLHSGDVLQTEVYQNAKEKLFQIANDQGYIKATFADSKILIDLKKYQADINLRLQTGDCYYFGKVTYNKNPYSPDFLQRFIPFRQDEPFSSKKLIAFQQNLAGSYFFTHVVATPDFEHIDNFHVPINLAVEAPKSQRYNVGIGYGSFTGPRITAGVNFRRLTDSGQHLDMQMQYSSVLSGLSAKYYIPGKDPLNDQWILGVNYQKFSPKHGESRSKTLSGTYATKTGNWQTNIGLNYLFERYRINNSPLQNSNLLYPDLNIVYTRANDLINPSHGLSLTFNLQGSSQSILSTTSFLQGEISGKYILSPASFNKFILRGDLGYTLVHDLQDLPLTMRFTTGGVNSVRGYADYSIGPGRYLEVGSIEYRNKIYGNLDAAAFYDIGTATDHLGSPLNSGAGLGLVYNSVIGPVKLYVARALNGTSQPKGVYLSIGPEF